MRNCFEGSGQQKDASMVHRFSAKELHGVVLYFLFTQLQYYSRMDIWKSRVCVDKRWQQKYVNCIL